jgi:hypothetical protein
MKHVVLALLLAWSLVTPARTETIPLLLQPAAAPVPALKYQLLPELRIQKADNAGPIYVAAQNAMKKIPDRNTDDEVLAKWRDLPTERLIKDNVKAMLEPYREVIDLVEQASRCETCDFGITDRLRKSGFGALIPEIQAMRPLANLLAMRARLELMEDRPEQALRYLRAGLAMSRHTGSQPILICTLVGVATSTVILNEVPHLVQHPRCPNLYWTLSDLPAPFLSLRPGLEGERLASYASFPGMAAQLIDLNADPMKPEQVQELLKTYSNLLDDQNALVVQTRAGFLLATRHDKAKKALIDQGRPVEKVAAMPHAQVGMLHAFIEYDAVMDEMLRWQAQPYWQATPKLEEQQRKLRRMTFDPEGPALTLARAITPAISKVMYSRVRLDRHIAQLRCLEALRLYAAAHEGKLPARLADITEVPIPVDPATGQPFVYQLSGDGATLACPQSPILPPQDQKMAKTYTLRRKSS